MDDAARPLDPEALLAEAGWLRALVRRLAGDADEASELEQETWRAALAQPPRVRDTRAWLAGVAQNLLRRRRRDALARAYHEARVAGERGAPEHDDGLETHARLDLLARVVVALRALEEPQRTALTLRYLDGLAYADVAQRTGTSEAVARKRVQRALEALRARLDRDSGGRREWAVLAFALGRDLPVPRGLAASMSSAAAAAGASTWIGGIAMETGAKVAAAVAACALLAGGVAWIGVRGEEAASSERGASVARPEVARALAEGEDLARAAEGEGERRADPTLRAPASAAAAEPAAPADVAAPPSYFTARLVDAAGRPVADGSLFVRQPLDLHRTLLARPDMTLATSLPLAVPRPPSAVGRSGRDGRVVLEVSDEDRARVARGVLDLRAVAPGLAARDGVAAPARPGESRELGDLVLAPGRAARGRVVLPAGVDPARVRVLLTRCTDPVRDEEARARQAAFGPLHHQVLDQTFVAAGGAFEIAGASQDAFSLWAYAPETGFARADVPAGAHDAEGVVLVIAPLAEGSFVAGRVVDPDGAPVARAWVHLLYADEARARTTTRSADDGAFRVALERGGAFTLVAIDEAFRLGEARVPARPGELDVELRMPGRPTFRVVVQDADGRRLASSRVEIFDPEGKTRWNYGGLEIERGVHDVALPPAPFGLRASAAGHASKLVALDPRAIAGEVTCTLALDAAVVGVVTAAGEPVEGARVVLRGAPPPGQVFLSAHLTGLDRPFELLAGAEASITTTDADGRFALSRRAGLPQLVDGPHVVTVDAGAGGGDLAAASSGAFHLTGRSATVEVALELPRAGAIAGRVLRADGVSAAGLVVAASRGDGSARLASTDAGGRYRIEGLAPGGWQIRRCRDAAAPAGSLVGLGTSGLVERPAGPAWDCTVVAGATTAYDLDLRDELAFALEGSIALGATSRTAALYRVGGAGEGPVAFAPVGDDGAFRLAASEEGAFELVISSGQVRVTERVHLTRGVARWTCDPERGELAVLAPAASAAAHVARGTRDPGRGELAVRAPAAPAVVHVARGPGDRVVRTWIQPGGDAREVPAGDGRLELAPPRGLLGEPTGVVLAEVSVRPLERTEITLE